jgi:hypothetical protein
MDKVIIANISGFYGDRLSAAQEMLEGGPVHYLTGDYLAELTMAILYKAKSKNPRLGYAHTFLKQMEGIMQTCLEKGVKVVTNAGGMNPKALAEALQNIAHTLQIPATIAYITGDDIMPRLTELGNELHHMDTGEALQNISGKVVSANAYLGCWGIVAALNKGADIVVTGRVADTALVMAPAAQHFAWSRDNWDALAGAAAAGHVIECSGQATGGNYSFFEDVPSFTKLGFPIAEIYADGSAVITKHPNTGGMVSIGTVSAQLLYEVRQAAYITPDVISHFDTIKLRQIGTDRVQLSNTKGSPPSNTAKLSINYTDGFQNTLTFLIAGLQIARKVEILEQCVRESLGLHTHFDKLLFQFYPTHKNNPTTNEEALATLKITVIDKDKRKAGKFFTAKIIEIALCTVPGICLAYPPMPAKPRIVHFPSLLDKEYISQHIHINGTKMLIQETLNNNKVTEFEKRFSNSYTMTGVATQKVYLGTLFAARSGDKGGNANVGVWASNSKTYAFLYHFLSINKLKTLLPDLADFTVERHAFPNLLGLNFYIIGFLGDGVAASTKTDAQAKTLGEYLRAKQIEVPITLLPKTTP